MFGIYKYPRRNSYTNMCLVIAKKHEEYLDDSIFSIIKSSAISNSDGMGYMIKRDGDKEIYIRKGLFET